MYAERPSSEPERTRVMSLEGETLSMPFRGFSDREASIAAAEVPPYLTAELTGF